MPARTVKRGPTAAQRAKTATRRAEAVKMRTAGADWQTIADTLGYSNKGSACTDVNRALEIALTDCRQATEALREQELQRLDVLWAEAWAVLKRNHVTVSHGRIISGLDGQPLLDDAPVLTAIDRLLKIQERRAKYLGLDAPTKHEVVTLDAVEAEIQRLAGELAQLDAEPGLDEADATAGAEAATD